MSRQTTVARVEEVCERVGQAEGFEIVEVELKGSGRNQLLRIFIDKPDGVTHGDCESVSHKVGDLLDAEDILPGHYVLEVSSPGVERKLKKPADFRRFQGQKIRVAIRENVMRENVMRDNVMREAGMREPESPERKSRFVEGVLAATEDSGVFLETSNGERLHIPFDAIDRANLKFEW